MLPRLARSRCLSRAASRRSSSSFLLDSTSTRSLPPTSCHEHRRSAIHLSAWQAGVAAREAGAARLILTHLWPFVDRDAAAAEGAEAFGDAVTLATQGLVTTI